MCDIVFVNVFLILWNNMFGVDYEGYGNVYFDSNGIIY